MIWMMTLLACEPHTDAPAVLPVQDAIRACLETDNPTQDAHLERRDFLIEGLVVSNDAADEMCNQAGLQRLTIAGDDGYTYAIGFHIKNGLGEDMTPAFDLQDGDAVSALYVEIDSFGVADGFVIRDAEGLVAAANVGTWGDPITSDEVPDVAVSSGEVLLTEDNECGTVTTREISFEADETITLAPGDDATLSISGQSMRAVAVHNTQWEGDVLCTDLAGTFVWALWR